MQNSNYTIYWKIVLCQPFPIIYFAGKIRYELHTAMYIVIIQPFDILFKRKLFERGKQSY